MYSFIERIFAWLCCLSVVLCIPPSSTNWQALVATDGVKFTARNAHASCVFKGAIWVTGGRTAVYTQYNLQKSYKMADVWYSLNGAIWKQMSSMKGDYFAQNSDVVQPGSLAPWYPRYGHSLISIDYNNDGKDDYMMLSGGFSPNPSNDIWITEDGETWSYCGQAPWAPRAWHGMIQFEGNVYVMGGSPLNNEVWVLNNITKIERRAPLTRSMYLNYTYFVNWTQLNDAPWSPRVGFGLVGHWTFNESNGESYTNSQPWMMVFGGYGGWPESHPSYDGIHGVNDVWASKNGTSWTLIQPNASFSPRAWFGFSVLTSMQDVRRDISVTGYNNSGKIYLFGGGFIGSYINTNAIVNSMDAKLDAFYSRDGVTWIQINYQEGGGKTFITQYSSQEWAKTTVNSATVYLGMWAMTVVAFNPTNTSQPPSNLFLIGGFLSGGGGMSNTVFQSKDGLFCDVEGVPCSYLGTCGSNMRGCECGTGVTGEYCEIFVQATSSAWKVSFVVSTTVSVLVGTLMLFLSMV